MECLDPVSAAAQGACGRLVADDVPEECKAVVLACPGLVPFVTAALDKLAELCACLLALPCQVVCWRGCEESVRAYTVRAITLRTVNACTLAAHKDLRVSVHMQSTAQSRVPLLRSQAYAHACPRDVAHPLTCKRGRCHDQQGALQVGHQACPPQAAERPAATRAFHMRAGPGDRSRQLWARYAASHSWAAPRARWPWRSRAPARWAQPCAWRSAVHARTWLPGMRRRQVSRSSLCGVCCAPCGRI